MVSAPSSPPSIFCFVSCNGITGQVVAFLTRKGCRPQTHNLPPSITRSLASYRGHLKTLQGTLALLLGSTPAVTCVVLSNDVPSLEITKGMHLHLEAW